MTVKQSLVRRAVAKKSSKKEKWWWTGEYKKKLGVKSTQERGFTV